MAAKQSKATNNEILLVANGDLRIAANQTCWAAQRDMEQALTDAIEAEGYTVRRIHDYKPDEEHGFIGSQKEGMAVFRNLSEADQRKPLIVAESVWQYSHHILHGLISHEGPLLTVANWSGQWPGLVGLLNLNGSLTKAGVKYSTLWSEDFTDDYFKKRLRKWLSDGKCSHPTKHVAKLEDVKVPKKTRQLGEQLAEQLQRDKAIMGVFDEGCMGMYNAIFPDGLLNPMGIYKERLSQSALYYATTQVSDEEAHGVRRWMEDKGMTFHTGDDPKEHLTDDQIHQQCKMYIAAVRIADDFGCDLFGIQYQQGLKDLLPASDLVEGTLNNSERPPVMSRDGKRELYAGEPIPHYNEVDQGCGVDALLTNRVQKALGQPPETTLHDLRWGDWDQSGTVDDYVWVFLISGSVPPAHNKGGWAGSDGQRQPWMFFPLGGSTLRGVSKPGEIVWSRVWIDGSKRAGQMCMDLGRAGVVELPDEETQRRWNSTTWQWPIMHAVTYGVSRDQMMARHKSNHLNVVYATDEKAADEALLTKAAMAEALGMQVSICGTRKDGKGWS